MTERYEADGWGDGPSIVAAEMLATLRATLEEAPIIVEHRLYRGSRAPVRRIFDDFVEFEAYLRREGTPGDAIWVWSFDALCRDGNALAHGKIPDAEGRVPRLGAY